MVQGSLVDVVSDGVVLESESKNAGDRNSGANDDSASSGMQLRRRRGGGGDGSSKAADVHEQAARVLVRGQDTIVFATGYHPHRFNSHIHVTGLKVCDACAHECFTLGMHCVGHSVNLRSVSLLLFCCANSHTHTH